MMNGAQNTNQLLIRYVIALNNIGVTLLEKQCYGQAADTFEDSIAVVLTTLRSENECAELFYDSSYPSNEIKAHTMYQTALTRLAQPCACKHEAIQGQSVSLDQHFAVSESTPSTPSGFRPFRVLEYSAHFLIRMEDEIVENALESTVVKNDISEEGGKPELHAAILMHNLGVAYFALSFEMIKRHSRYSCCLQACTCQDSAVASFLFYKYQRKAAHVFRHAYSIFVKESKKNDRTHFYFPEIILRGMVATLHSLVQSERLLPMIATFSSPTKEQILNVEYFIAVLHSTQKRLYYQEVVCGIELCMMNMLAPAA